MGRPSPRGGRARLCVPAESAPSASGPPPPPHRRPVAPTTAASCPARCPQHQTSSPRPPISPGARPPYPPLSCFTFSFLFCTPASRLPSTNPDRPQGWCCTAPAPKYKHSRPQRTQQPVHATRGKATGRGGRGRLGAQVLRGRKPRYPAAAAARRAAVGGAWAWAWAGLAARLGSGCPQP